MRFNKVLLINPSYGGNYGATLLAGLGYIAEKLNDIGVDYRVIDMELGYKINNVIRRIIEYQPDLIGFSMITFRYKNIFKYIEYIKRKTGVRIIVGGPFVSTLRKKVLSDCQAIDYGVVLEGEETLKELCLGKEIAEIKGLIHRQGLEVIYNGDRPFIGDLDSLSFPRYQGFEFSKYPTNVITIVSSRGCPYDCIYCPASLAVGKKMRFRSAKSIVDEIKYWHELNYRRFGFADDNFTLIPQRVYEICDEIEREGLKGLHLILGNGIRADKVDERLLRRMKEVGFHNISLGVESGSQEVLNKMKKAETLVQIEKAIELCCKLNFEVKLHFVLGIPGETLADVKKSIDLALKYPVAEVSFNNLIPYPGTELFDWLTINNCFICSPDYYLNSVSPAIRRPLFITSEMNLEQRKKAFVLVEHAESKVRYQYFLKTFGISLICQIAAKIFSIKMVNRLVSTNSWLKRFALRRVAVTKI